MRKVAVEGEEGRAKKRREILPSKKSGESQRFTGSGSRRCEAEKNLWNGQRGLRGKGVEHLTAWEWRTSVISEGGEWVGFWTELGLDSNMLRWMLWRRWKMTDDREPSADESPQSTGTSNKDRPRNPPKPKPKPSLSPA